MMYYPCGKLGYMHHITSATSLTELTIHVSVLLNQNPGSSAPLTEKTTLAGIHTQPTW